MVDKEWLPMLRAEKIENSQTPSQARDLRFRGPFMEAWQFYFEPSSTSAMANNLLTVFQFRPVEAHCSVFSILTSGIFG